MSSGVAGWMTGLGRRLRSREPEPLPLQPLSPERGPDRSRLIWLLVMTVVVVVVHNVLVHRYDLGPVYVLVGLAVAVVAVVAPTSTTPTAARAARWLPLGRFGPACPWLLTAAALALVLVIFDPVADERLAEAGAGELWRGALVSVFGVAVIEEVLFRQILLVAWSRVARRPPRGIGPAGLGLVVSSVAFGFWHVAAEQARVDASGGGSWGVLAGVAATGLLAGPFLAAVRLRSNGLLAPVLVHASFNVAVAVGVWL